MLGVAIFFRYSLTIIILSEISLPMKLFTFNHNLMKRIATFKRNSITKLRVIKGFPDVNDKYPYVVTLEKKLPSTWLPFHRSCSGSVISSQFVITAAHCLSPDLHFVRCGNMTLTVKNSTCLSKILKQYRSPSYVNMERTLYSTLYNDIALLSIEKLVISSYGRLNFADYKTLIGRAAKYAGYGATSYSTEAEVIFAHQKMPLQIGEGVIFNDDDKQLSYPHLLIASKCSNRNQYAYRGDSGGPLLVDNKIVGVYCSFTEHMLQRIKIRPPLFMYTPVSPYLDWIRQITINEKK